jgi:hypothetical protein
VQSTLRRVRPPPTIAAVALLALSVLIGTACGSSGSGSTAGCGPIKRELLDPQFLVHVLGDAKVQYTSNPPTSGPHQPTPPVTGVQADPIPKPVQVGLLEAGDVLLQHRPDLPAAQRAELEALAGHGVVVAPAADLPAAVVATAWVYKRTCSSVDPAALREFVTARQGKAPGSTPAP